MSNEKKVSFEAWWAHTQKNMEKPFPSHLKEIIFVDMKARGLTKSETMDKYEEALVKFGYKSV